MFEAIEEFQPGTQHNRSAHATPSNGGIFSADASLTAFEVAVVHEAESMPLPCDTINAQLHRVHGALNCLLMDPHRSLHACGLHKSHATPVVEPLGRKQLPGRVSVSLEARAYLRNLFVGARESMAKAAQDAANTIAHSKNPNHSTEREFLRSVLSNPRAALHLFGCDAPLPLISENRGLVLEESDDQMMARLGISPPYGL